MADDKTKRGVADRNRVNLHEDYEVRDWCKSLGCSKDELAAAVKAVGPMANDVRAYLTKQRK